MRLAYAVSLVVLLAACSDDKQSVSQQMMAPKAARLSLKTLSSDASSVCRANVASRDELLASGVGDGDKLSALDNVISDVCY